MTVHHIPSRLHFVGVGGAGMSAIAWVLAARGKTITGSDRAPNGTTDWLMSKGVRVLDGHAAEHVGEAEAVVVSTAIPADNPEVLEARRRGIPIWHRAQALATILDASEGICIAGTHGKTTTTSMTAKALDAAGADPTVLIGGELADYGGNAKIGAGPHTVAEADESDASLLNFHPAWAIVTNIDLEHMDHYRDEAHLIATFRQFLSQVKPTGGAVVWHDDPRLAQIRAEAPCRIWTYSSKDLAADYLITDHRFTADGTRFSVAAHEGGKELCEVTLHVPGFHNTLNATAVIALSHRMGLDLDKACEGLAAFRGAKRRFQHKGSARGVTIYDDYAHHPTEIRATLEAARSVHRDGRLVAVFQPHRFTRTQSLWREFANVLSNSVDALVLTDVYSAGENPIEGVTSRLIYDALGGNQPQSRALVGSLPEAVTHLREHVRPGDWVFTLGAGNVYQVGEALLEQLSRETAVPA